MDQEFIFRPYTTRKYLQPPKSERLFTVWPEGKYIFGDIFLDFAECNRDPVHYFNRTFVGAGLWFAHGAGDAAFIFGNTLQETSESGAPIHLLRNGFRDMEVRLEAFCDTRRKSTLFIKMTAENTGDSEMHERVSLLVRTGPEEKLVFGKADMYAHYRPEIEAWGKIPASWREEQGHFTDGERVLTVSEYAAFSEAEGRIILFDGLQPREKKQFVFSLNKGECISFDYDAEKSKTEAFWEKEFARIDRLPAALADDPEKRKMIRHITAQILQMFACPAGTDLVIPRQGGLRRIIWPVEALSMLEGLAYIGDFADYIEPCIQFYFDFKMLPSGEVEQTGFGWAGITAAALYSFSKYCTLTGNGTFFRRYRDKAYRAFLYIKRIRHTTADSETCAGGLFPPLRGCDWDQVFQVWGMTDTTNILAEKAFAEACARFGDPALDEVQEEHASYVADMKRHFRKYYEAQSGSETLRIPLMPIGDERKLVEELYPEHHHGSIILCGAVDRYEDVLRVYRSMLECGLTREGLGLYGHMPYKNGKKGIWYVSYPDYYWFEVWMKYGRRDKAAEIIDAQLTFGMSREYAFTERIDTESPTYTPWMPNGSAMGRILIMLAEYYGSGEKE